MSIRGVTPILNVSSVRDSQTWFARVGWRAGFSWPDGEGETPTFGSACSDTDEPWGVREFHLRHPDGHMFRVSGGLGEAED